MECRYVFIGHGRERVQIIFSDFSLYHPGESRGEGGEGEVGSGSGSSNNPQHNFGSYPAGETQTLLSVQRYLNGNPVNDRDSSGPRKR